MIINVIAMTTDPPSAPICRGAIIIDFMSIANPIGLGPTWMRLGSMSKLWIAAA